jgi:hypothetical protein
VARPPISSSRLAHVSAQVAGCLPKSPASVPITIAGVIRSSPQLLSINPVIIGKHPTARGPPVRIFDNFSSESWNRS